LHVEDEEELAIDLGTQPFGLLFVAAAVEDDDCGVGITLADIGDQEGGFLVDRPARLLHLLSMIRLSGCRVGWNRTKSQKS
jgi:hypothetical protein